MDYVLAVHGGAGVTIARGEDDEKPYRLALRAAVKAGETLLRQGASALDAVTAAVVSLEDCPLFNAGHGSVYTRDATHELDASVMNGRDRACGAVAGVDFVRNPVLLARAVMERSDAVLLIAEGARRFAQACGFETVSPDYFATSDRLDQLRRAQAACGAVLLDHEGAALAPASHRPPIDPDAKFGTIGAVARDMNGDLAAAVSTGGMTNKLPGRVGDSPLVGCGIYADNATVAVSATGTGEHFIRLVTAYEIAARTAFAGQALEQAAHEAIFGRLQAMGGRGGVIAIDRLGNLSMPFNTAGMYRGWVRSGGPIDTAIFDSPGGVTKFPL